MSASPAAASPAATAPRDRVVVGIDGSDDSLTALRAAARAAELLHAELVVVTTWLQEPTFGRTPLWLPDFQRDTEQLQHRVLQETFGDAPPVPIRPVVCGGSPAGALRRESEGARLVVVGRRGHGGFGALLLGSTAMATVVHAGCSVLVLGHDAKPVPSDVDEPGGHRVVVGVDGEPPSIRALAVADRAAVELDARLDVVTAWTVFGGYPGTIAELQAAVEADEKAKQQAAIEAVVPGERRGRIRQVVAEGSPSAVLVEQSAHADLLVVGIRSRSAVVEAFTGAVALTTAAHADCPVLVVRDGAR